MSHHEGDLPTTNQPLNAKPRPKVGPAVLVVVILAVALVIVFGLTLL